MGAKTVKNKEMTDACMDFKAFVASGADKVFMEDLRPGDAGRMTVNMLARWATLGLDQEAIIAELIKSGAFKGERPAALKALAVYELYAGHGVIKGGDGKWTWGALDNNGGSQSGSSGRADHNIFELKEMLKQMSTQIEELKEEKEKKEKMDKRNGRPFLTIEELEKWENKEDNRPGWMEELGKMLKKYLQRVIDAERNQDEQDKEGDAQKSKAPKEKMDEDALDSGDEVEEESGDIEELEDLAKAGLDLAEDVWEVMWENNRKYKERYRAKGKGIAVDQEEEGGVVEEGKKKDDKKIFAREIKGVKIYVKNGKEFFLAKSGAWMPLGEKPRSDCERCKREGKGSQRHWYMQCPFWEVRD